MKVERGTNPTESVFYPKCAEWRPRICKRSLGSSNHTEVPFFSHSQT